MLDLDLGMNKLEYLPEAIGNMSRLVNLNLSDNKLTDLPLSIGNCKVLNAIFIERYVGRLDSREVVQFCWLVFFFFSLDSFQFRLISSNPIQDQEMLAKYNLNIDHFKNYLEKRYFCMMSFFYMLCF
jgi:Leucine-rich repeat (LRR) protein